jgi:hypothetical protein
VLMVLASHAGIEQRADHLRLHDPQRPGRCNQAPVSAIRILSEHPALAQAKLLYRQCGVGAADRLGRTIRSCEGPVDNRLRRHARGARLRERVVTAVAWRRPGSRVRIGGTSDASAAFAASSGTWSGRAPGQRSASMPSPASRSFSTSTEIFARPRLLASREAAVRVSYARARQGAESLHRDRLVFLPWTVGCADARGLKLVHRLELVSSNVPEARPTPGSGLPLPGRPQRRVKACSAQHRRQQAIAGHCHYRDHCPGSARLP